VNPTLYHGFEIWRTTEHFYAHQGGMSSRPYYDLACLYADIDQKHVKLTSADCAMGDHASCDQEKCACDCHAAIPAGRLP
jgi:hypothetical protein